MVPTHILETILSTSISSLWHRGTVGLQLSTAADQSESWRDVIIASGSRVSMSEAQEPGSAPGGFNAQKNTRFVWKLHVLVGWRQGNEGDSDLVHLHLSTTTVGETEDTQQSLKEYPLYCILYVVNTGATSTELPLSDRSSATGSNCSTRYQLYSKWFFDLWFRSFGYVRHKYSIGHKIHTRLMFIISIYILYILKTYTFLTWYSQLNGLFTCI